MSSWLWITVILVVLALAVYFVNRRKTRPPGQAKAPSLFGGLFAPSNKILIERFKAETEREKARAKELGDVLQAKRDLYKAKAANSKVLQEIAGVTEENSGDGEKPPAAVKTSHKT